MREVLRALVELEQVTIAAIDGVRRRRARCSDVLRHSDLHAAIEVRLPMAGTLGNALSAEVVDRCVATFGSRSLGRCCSPPPWCSATGHTPSVRSAVSSTPPT